MEVSSNSGNPILTHIPADTIQPNFDQQKRSAEETIVDNQSTPSITTSAPSSTIYEIDLFCYECNHYYKSVMSFNRHLKTKKHAERVTQLNEFHRRRSKRVEQHWPNYESYLSQMGWIPHAMYNSIVNTLLEDSENYAASNGATSYYPPNGLLLYNKYQQFRNQTKSITQCCVCFEQFPSQEAFDMHKSRMSDLCAATFGDMDADMDILCQFV